METPPVAWPPPAGGDDLEDAQFAVGGDMSVMTVLLRWLKPTSFMTCLGFSSALSNESGSAAAGVGAAGDVRARLSRDTP
jgi:hypothetical protein